VDSIVSGELAGQYLMLLGPKGTGKSSMVIDAAVKADANGFAMLECHEDPEVVRLRLGIALDFQYNVSRLMSLGLGGLACAAVVPIGVGGGVLAQRDAGAIDGRGKLTPGLQTLQEDSFAGLFQRKDPREGGALLDVSSSQSSG